MHNQTHRTRHLPVLLHAGLLFFLLQPVFPSAAEPPAAALVVGCEGAVTAKAGDGARKLEPMALLDRDEVVSTGPDGQLTLLFFPDGREYTLGPKSSARLREKAVERLTGTVTASGGGKVAVGLPPNPRITSKRVAGEVLRGDRPYRGFLAPPPNGATLEPRPEFRWTGRSAEDALRLTLMDAAGKQLASREVRGDRLSAEHLGAPELEPGRAYTVRLHPAAASGLEDPSASFTARFRVLPRHEAGQVLQARRAAEAARNAGRKADPAVLEYFFLLAELKLYPEAIQVGESLRRELPGNIFILRFLALAYRESGQRDTSNQLLEEIITIEAKPRPPAVSE
ncbi:MAG: hypothetical protein KA419_17555 [Acidobacteria bacterium]|nr:hypothetical protein [Acidobacteriota bacterium]